MFVSTSDPPPVCSWFRPVQRAWTPAGSATSHVMRRACVHDVDGVRRPGRPALTIRARSRCRRSSGAQCGRSRSTAEQPGPSPAIRRQHRARARWCCEKTNIPRGRIARRPRRGAPTTRSARGRRVSPLSGGLPVPTARSRRPSGDRHGWSLIGTPRTYRAYIRSRVQGVAADHPERRSAPRAGRLDFLHANGKV